MTRPPSISTAAALLVLAVAAFGGADRAYGSNDRPSGPAAADREVEMTHPPEASRPAPPVVPPVFLKGVRYEQDLDSAQHGGDPLSGYLMATDVASGARLWMLKIYQVTPQTAPGLPRFNRYFKRLSLVPDRDALAIEDEAGTRYLVDLSRRVVTIVSPPPAPTPETKPLPTPE